MENIIIYTDGSSLGNPGPGGWAAIVIKGKDKTVYSGGYRWTTNNRMELIAVIEALRRIDKKDRSIPIKIFTDSRLLVDAINNKWLEKWEKNYWWRGTSGKKEKVLNKDLWLDLLPLLSLHKVEFEWVKAHAGTANNELADSLSKEEAQKKGNPPDIEYEKTNPVQLVFELETDKQINNIVYEEDIQIGRSNYKVRLQQTEMGKKYIEIIQFDEIPRFREVFSISEFIEFISFLTFFKNKTKIDQD